MRDHRTWIAIGVACLALPCIGDAPAADAIRKPVEVPRATRDARALAATIDRLRAEKWAEAKVIPAGPADDGEYLRRVSLDLVGKI